MDILLLIKDKVKQEFSGINKEARNKIAGYIVAAFGLVAGLAWNDAIKSFIEHVFPLKENSILAKFIYAVAITLVLVLVSVYVVRILKGKEENKKGDKK